MNESYLSESEIKHELVNMFSILCDFLDEKKIKYSIAYGTLLGAVRHKGFIPWDDDIDIIMLREDYEKFKAILKKDNNISGYLKGMGFELGVTYYPYIKVVNPKICTKEKVVDGIYEEGFLWIDVFPMDGMPNYGAKLFTKYIDVFLRNTYEYKRCQTQFPKMMENAKNGIKSKILEKINFEKFLRFYIKQCSLFKIEKNEYMKDYIWNHFKKLPRNLMDEISEYDFEGIKVKGCKDYDTFLSTIYGDYMTIPPVEKRVTHGLIVWKNEM